MAILTKEDLESIIRKNKAPFKTLAELDRQNEIETVDIPACFSKSKRQEVALSEDYPEYFKDVSHLNKIDVYTVHQLFNIQDPSGCIHHASKKLLLSGSRNGGKTKYQDIKEARDSLNRWLALNQGDDADKVH